MKVITGLVAVLLLAGAGLPPVLGIVTENQVKARVDTARDNEFLDMRVVDYQRGWFDSSARLELALDEEYVRQIEAAIQEQAPAEADPAALDDLAAMFHRAVTLDVEILHGPLTIDEEAWAGLWQTRIGIDPATPGLQDLLAELEIPYLIAIRSRTGFTGRSQFDGDMPAFDWQSDSERIEFSGMTMNGSFDWSGEEIQSRVSVDEIAIESNEAAISVQSIGVNGDMSVLSSYLWLGVVTGNIGRLAVATTGSPEASESVLIVDELDFETEVAFQDDQELLDIRAEYRVASVTGNEDFTVTDAHLGVALRGVDPQVVERYNHLTRQLDSAAADGDTDAAAREFQALIYDLLSTSPTLSADPVELNWNNDRVHATFHLHSDAQRLPSRGQFAIEDLEQWQRILSADASADIAKPLAIQVATQVLINQLSAGEEIQMDAEEAASIAAMQAPVMLDTLVEQGLIQDTGESYKAQVQMRDGAIEINDLVLPLGAVAP